MNNLRNPFSITKANEFNDIEINNYWVSFNIDSSHLDPRELMPKYILGGKGCGKTHLLRYFSYPLQKIRNTSIDNIIYNDNYIGVYSVLDGLNSSRFTGKGVDDEQWKSVFEYYFELYICEILLDICKDIFEVNLSNSYTEEHFIKDVCGIFFEKIIGYKESYSINVLKQKLSDLRKKIDVQIVNAAFFRTLDYNSVKILFNPSSLLFGIPDKLSSNIEPLSKINFIYILDEYEKLFEWQKEYINTLVWEKKAPCTFWIGARKYGYTTTKTKNIELIKPGSEFQPVYLDKIFQENEVIYKDFAKKLYLSRLKSCYPTDYTLDKIEEIFSSKFEKYSDDIITENIKKNKGKNGYRFYIDLKQKIKDGLGNNKLYSKFDIDNCLLKLLEDTNENPLEQKYKVYLFYKEWANWNSKRSNINGNKVEAIVDIDRIIEYVNSEYLANIKNENSVFADIKDKYKTDLLAQLTRESKIKNTCYSGIDEFINLSWGNPRVFLLILKTVIDKSDLFGENPMLDGSSISLDAQYLSVLEIAKWFYQDVEIVGDSGKNLYKSINSLSNIFQLYRFSDKLTETSVCAFNCGIEVISQEAKDYIDLALTHSLIIEVPERKQKSSGRSELTFQINRILSPLWNLPTSRRGVADFSAEIIETIFNPAQHAAFESIYVDLKSRFSAPFSEKKNKRKKTNKIEVIELNNELNLFTE